MALVFKDRVRMTTTTTGTGTLTLGSAVTGYQAFSAIGDGNTCYFCIEAIDANGIPTGDWEVSLGTYTTAGTTLSRTTTLASSNGGSAVNLSAGTKHVFCAAHADLIALIGTLDIASLTEDDLATDDYVPFRDTSGSDNNKTSISRLLGFASASLCEGRLTLESGVSVSTTNQTSKTSVYFTPHIGDRITIYDGTRLRLYQFSELTLALGTLTSGLPYDVFIYDDSGTLTLESLAWTNGTTRATALVRQNGAWYKTGALTRRYLGSFYTTSTTTTEDSRTKRLLFNAMNPVPRPIYVANTTSSWTYGTASFRSANADNTLRAEIIQGIAQYPIDLSLGFTIASAFIQPGIGEDSTTATDTGGGGNGLAFHFDPNGTVAVGNVAAWLKKVPSVGYHYYQWLENAANGTTGTVYNYALNQRQSGITGIWWC